MESNTIRSVSSPYSMLIVQLREGKGGRGGEFETGFIHPFPPFPLPFHSEWSILSVCAMPFIQMNSFIQYGEREYGRRNDGVESR